MKHENRLTFRPATMDDAATVLALICRCESAEYGSPDTDLEDVTHYWQQVDIATRTRLAFAADGTLKGYAAVLPWGDDLNYEFYVDPDSAETDLSARMLAFCIACGPTVIDKPTTAHAVVGHANQRDAQLLRDAHFAPGSFYHQMAFVAKTPPTQPTWPVGVTVRTFQPGVDERAVHHVIESAFFRPDRTATPFAAWSDHMLRADIFEPDLWFLAIADDAVIGASLAYNYETGGWVRQLGVLPQWQGNGIGASLLRHTFGRFYERGVKSVALSVDSKRPDAHRFYQRVGMTQVRQYDEYTIEVKPA